MINLREQVGRWRALALTVGTLLVVLVFVGLPLKYGADSAGVVKIVGPAHGFLYILYFLYSLTLARRFRWGISRTLLTLAAGLVPLLTFVVERKVAREAEPVLTQ